MALLPKMGEIFEVVGRAGRVWTCRTPPAEAWVLAGYTTSALARGTQLGQALARLVHEDPERRAALLQELLAPHVPSDPGELEAQQVERVQALQRAWAHLLPDTVLSCRVGEQSNRVRVVLTVAEEGEDADGTERVCVANTALLDDWWAIHNALSARFGQGAELGARFRHRAAPGPAAGGPGGAPVRAHAV